MECLCALSGELEVKWMIILILHYFRLWKKKQAAIDGLAKERVPPPATLLIRTKSVVRESCFCQLVNNESGPLHGVQKVLQDDTLVRGMRTRIEIATAN